MTTDAAAPHSRIPRRRLRLLIAGICATLALGIAVWWEAGSDQRTRDRLQRLGQAPVRSGGEDEPLQELQRLSQEKGAGADVWYWLGKRFTVLGRHPEALEALSHAATLNPDSAPVRAALGLALVNNGRLEEAEAELQRALATTPRLATAHFALGRVWGRRQQWETAAGHLKQASDLDPNDLDARYLLAACYEHMQQEDKRLEILESLAKAAPNNARFLKALGNAYLFQGRFSDGESVYRKALRIDPNDLETHYLLGRALAEGSNTPAAFDEAESELTSVAEQVKNGPGIQLALGILYSRKKDPQRAIPRLEAAVALGSTETKTWLYLGQAYLQAGRAAEGQRALARFERESRLNRDISQLANRLYSLPETTPEQRREKSDVRERLARAYLEGGAYLSAQKHLAILLRERPQDPHIILLSRECEQKIQAGRSDAPAPLGRSTPSPSTGLINVPQNGSISP